MTETSDSFQLNYITGAKFNKTVAVKVELYPAGDTYKLNVLKISDKTWKTYEDIWVENISAVTLTSIKVKKGKNVPGLIIFWTRHDECGEWNQMIFHDMDQPNELNCVGNLKRKLMTKCFKSGLGPLRSEPDDVAHELQCSRRFVAIVPDEEGNTLALKCKDIVQYCKRMTGNIFNKSANEISLINQSNSSTTSVTFLTSSKGILRYKCKFGTTVDMISREISTTIQSRDPASPLPPTPSTQLLTQPSLITIRPPPRLSNTTPTRCGSAPPITEKPFWLPVVVPHNPEGGGGIEIYNQASADIKQYLAKKYRHIETVCTRKPSKRFGIFLNKVNIEPTMIESVCEDQHSTSSEVVYRRPRVSVILPHQYDVSPCEFYKENVEDTLAECLRKIGRDSRCRSADSCPIGMSRQERQTFCWRLDLVENDILMGEGWKNFASHVMHLDSNDLEMIDEFSCKYKCQVVEVVLDHWYKLYKLRSSKCRLPAVRESIVQALRDLEKFDLLYHLKWEND